METRKLPDGMENIAMKKLKENIHDKHDDENLA